MESPCEQEIRSSTDLAAKSGYDLERFVRLLFRLGLGEEGHGDIRAVALDHITLDRDRLAVGEMQREALRNLVRLVEGQTGADLRQIDQCAADLLVAVAGPGGTAERHARRVSDFLFGWDHSLTPGAFWQAAL